MAQRGQKDLLTRLADAGEDALQRLASTPGADRVLGVMTNMREQMDALTNRVRGIEELERRIDKLERRVATMAKSSRATAPKSTARKTTKSSTAKASASRSTGTTRKKTS